MLQGGTLLRTVDRNKSYRGPNNLRRFLGDKKATGALLCVTTFRASRPK